MYYMHLNGEFLILDFISISSNGLRVGGLTLKHLKTFSFYYPLHDISLIIIIYL